MRQPIRRFYLICEGKNTEPNYFNTLKAILRPAQIEIICTTGAGVPMTISEVAVRIMKENGLDKRSRKKLSSFEEKDEVWAVFDRDEHPKYKEAKDYCIANEINIAYSDPCFELWLNLHFGESDGSCNRVEVQKKTEELVTGYSRKTGKTADFTQMIESLAEAEARAERQMGNRTKEGNPEGNPSTSVFLLMRSIKSAAEKSKP